MILTVRSNQNSLIDLKNIEDFILHFNQENMEYSSIQKLHKISKNLSLKMKLKIKVSKFFYSYLANYILLRPTMTDFSEECVLCFEEMLMDSIANISQGNHTDVEFLFFILVICQEIFMKQFYFGKQLFSEKFLKFFRKLNFMYNKTLWIDLYNFLLKESISKSALFYFFNPTSGNSTNFYSKTLFNTKEKLLLYLMQISFYLLQQPHQIILNNFIFVNQETINFPISKLMNISTFMEKSISSVYKTNKILGFVQQKQNEPGCLFVLGKAIEFLGLEDKALLLDLLILTRKHHNYMKKLLFNKILSEQENIPRETRKQLYKKLMILDAENFYGSIAQSMYVTRERDSHQDSATIVKMDVERTKFFKGDPEQLIDLLKNVGEYIPSVGYYQGLNCLGAFVLEYFDDFVFSFDIISFCLHRHMKKYFFGDFRKLNKLVFIGETLLQEYFPDVYSMIESTNIGHGYYLSSIILTIFFSILQFVKFDQFILATLDLYTSEGWVGFYKVFIYIVSKSINDIRKQSPDEVIHYMKKTIFLDLKKRDISNLKSFCHSLKITNEKLNKIEKKYSKSRYVLSDFWNSYFKSKKAESNRLTRRNSMPQSMIDNQEMRVHSRSENYSLMTLEKEDKGHTYGLNNSLIISMKIREELKNVQSEMPYNERDFEEMGHHTINPRDRPIFSSSNSKGEDGEGITRKDQRWEEQKSEGRVDLKLENNTRVSSHKEKSEEVEDFIERNSNLSQLKPKPDLLQVKQKKKKKKKMVSFNTESNEERNSGSNHEKVLKRFRTSQSAQTSPGKTNRTLLSKNVLPVHAFVKKKKKSRKAKSIKRKNI
jgi:hypothetical protein